MSGLKGDLSNLSRADALKSRDSERRLHRASKFKSEMHRPSDFFTREVASIEKERRDGSATHSSGS